MKAWISDTSGSTSLVRTGTGVVTAVAVAPVRHPGDAADSLVEIAVQAVTPKAIRVTVKATCPRDSELALRAAHLAESGEEVAWLIEWRRLPGIPDEIPITDLQLRTDATAYLLALASSESALPSVGAPAASAESRG